MQFVGRRGLKLWNEMAVEVPGFVCFGVDQQPTTADLGTKHCHPRNDVTQQTRTEATLFVLDRDTEPGQQRNGLRIAASAAPHSLRRVIKSDTRHAPRVVRNDFTRL